MLIHTKVISVIVCRFNNDCNQLYTIVIDQLYISGIYGLVHLHGRVIILAQMHINHMESFRQ